MELTKGLKENYALWLYIASQSLRAPSHILVRWFSPFARTPFARTPFARTFALHELDG